MSSRDQILVGCALAGVAISLYVAYNSKVTANAATGAANSAANPLAAAASEIENDFASAGKSIEQWFATLWGSRSSGGTPEATSGS